MYKTLLTYINRQRQNVFVLQSINTMLLRIFGVLVLFCFTLFLTRNYNPKLIGQYDFVRTFLLVIGSISILGTDLSIIYFKGILKSRNELSELIKIYKKMLFLVFTASIILLLLFLLIGQNTINTFFEDEQTHFIIYKSLLILSFYSITLLNTEVLRALDYPYLAELFRNTLKYLSVIIGSIVLLKLHKETYLVDSFLIGFIFLSIISTIIIIKYFKKWNRKGLSNRFSHLYIFKKSFPMSVSNISIFLLLSIDIFFLKKYRGDESVAYYSVSVKLMTILFMIMNSVNITASPKIAELFSTNKMDELSYLLKRSARLIFFLTLPIVLITVLFSEEILKIFGDYYVNANEALLVAIIGQGICSLFGVVHVYLNMTGRQNIFQFILIFAVVLNFVLNKTLIPIYGMTGGAISYVISMFAWNLIATIIIYKKDKVKVFLT